MFPLRFVLVGRHRCRWFIRQQRISIRRWRWKAGAGRVSSLAPVLGIHVRCPARVINTDHSNGLQVVTIKVYQMSSNTHISPQDEPLHHDFKNKRIVSGETSLFGDWYERLHWPTDRHPEDSASRVLPSVDSDYRCVGLVFFLYAAISWRSKVMQKLWRLILGR